MNISKRTGNTIIDNLIQNMVYVEGATFTMGHAPLDNCAKVLHKVTLSSFYINKYAVTQREWVEIMGSNPSRFVNPNNPVDNVSWDDCIRFFVELNKRCGLSFYFPTEAQWEFAAKGGKHSKNYLYSGSDNCSEVAWHYWNSGEIVRRMISEATWFNKAKYKEQLMNNKTHPVGSLKSNELGIYDMSGNVNEWCNDWYEEFTSDSTHNPQGPPNGERKIIRGGCFSGDRGLCRVINRDTMSLKGSLEAGLRIALRI